MSVYNVKVTMRSRAMYVSVAHGLTGAGHPHLFVRSSGSVAATLPDPGPWPTGLPWSVVDRLRNGGDEKGRVLGVWQESPGREPVPLAVLAWHAHGAGPLYVFDVGHTAAVSEAVGRVLTAVLLDVLLEAAVHPNAPVATQWQRRLRWSQVALAHAPHRNRQAYRRENLRRALTMRFTQHQPPPAAPRWTRGAWLGERAF
jgi:hypothetical protein